MHIERNLTDLIAIEEDAELSDVEKRQAAARHQLRFVASGGQLRPAVMAAIKQGHFMLGVRGHKDFYGNPVPARTEVKAGTPVSFEFVVQTRGLEWAERMASAGETAH